MASRTRERLIVVARQLFARQGIENTTMNDIASASDRGRRTLYTYFRTKSDIYQAVVEDEARRIVAELEEKVNAESSPADKLRALMEYRITIALDRPHGYQVWLKSLFSRDVKRGNAIRALVTDRIYAMLDEIMAEGVAAGDFIPGQAGRLPAMLTMIVRGSDWTLVRETDREQFARWRRDCVSFIIDAVQTNRNHIINQ